MLTDNFWWPLVFPIDTNHISQETGGDGEQQQVLSAPEAVEAEGQRVHDGEEFLQPLMTEQPTCREYHLKRVTVTNCFTEMGGSLVEGFGWSGIWERARYLLLKRPTPHYWLSRLLLNWDRQPRLLYSRLLYNLYSSSDLYSSSVRRALASSTSWDEVARTKFQDKYDTNWGGNPREKKSERNPKKNCTAACSAHWQAEPAGLRLRGQPLCKHL